MNGIDDKLCDLVIGKPDVPFVFNETGGGPMYKGTTSEDFVPFVEKEGE